MSLNALHSYFRRNATTIGIVIVIISLGAILGIQSVALNRLQDQAHATERVLSSVEKVTAQINSDGIQRTEQINELSRHLDCIVQFFSQPDRSSKAIANINSCELESITSGVSTSTQYSGTSAHKQIPQTINNSTSTKSLSPENATPSNQASQSTPPFNQNGTPLIEQLLNPIKKLN